MHIPPGFEISQTTGKVLRLHRSLYGLKQSPQAWFDRFIWAILKTVTSKVMLIIH